MPAHPGLPIAAVEAIKHRRYPEAIQLLEAFCRSQASPASKDYLQAQVWLVKAYQETGQVERAIALCRQLARSPHPKIQTWAQKTLPSLTPSLSERSPLSPPGGLVSEAETLALAASVDLSPPPPESATPAETPQYLKLSADEAAEQLTKGNRFLKTGQFAKAVGHLEAFCCGSDPGAKDYEQAQMWLAKAYKGNGQTEEAIALCQKLLTSEKDFIQIWAQRYLQTLAPELVPPEMLNPPSARADLASEAPKVVPIPKAGRAKKWGVKLVMKGVAANLALASTVTLSLLFGMVLVLSLSLTMIVGSADPTTGLITSIGITLIVNAVLFFISPFIMDLTQAWLYGTKWVTLSYIERHSPEAARVIKMVCQQKNLNQPRLGVINDQNPTAFTYGSLPGDARLVVSEGLFTYLDDDEIATVYAHELGHIIHWDFAVMTLASTLVQITYLIYTYTREMTNRLGRSDVEKKIKDVAQTTAMMAYVFYVAGQYLTLYLSRTREYYADHFAAEVTGNPNGLSRALVKIAYGIMEEGKRSQEPSKVLQGTRALGIADSATAGFTGTAYRVATEPYKVGRVFLWDMFNPWAWWMELSSTHPLTGKRIRALSTYAEQIGVDVEFDMAKVVREGRTLNKSKLYGNFILDLLTLKADWLGIIIGGTMTAALAGSGSLRGAVLLSFPLFGFGVGTLIKTFVMYPNFNRAPATDVLTLMSDPYASPLRGTPVKVTGDIIGRGDAGNKFGSDLKLQDPTGMIYLRYCSRFGPLGNFLFGMTQAEGFFRQPVSAVGWFRRGSMPWVDLILMTCPAKWDVHSYHRFWLWVAGFGAIALSFVMPTLAR